MNRWIAAVVLIATSTETGLAQNVARRPKDCSTSSSNPMMEGPRCRFRREARARERHRIGGQSGSA